MVRFVSDGVSAMVGTNNGVAVKLKKNSDTIRRIDFFLWPPLCTSPRSSVY